MGPRTSIRGNPHGSSGGGGVDALQWGRGLPSAETIRKRLVDAQAAIHERPLVCGSTRNSTRASTPPGATVTTSQMDAVALVPDSFHGEWNYSLLP